MFLAQANKLKLQDIALLVICKNPAAEFAWSIWSKPAYGCIWSKEELVAFVFVMCKWSKQNCRICSNKHLHSIFAKPCAKNSAQTSLFVSCEHKKEAARNASRYLWMGQNKAAKTFIACFGLSDCYEHKELVAHARETACHWSTACKKPKLIKILRTYFVMHFLKEWSKQLQQSHCQPLEVEIFFSTHVLLHLQEGIHHSKHEHERPAHSLGRHHAAKSSRFAKDVFIVQSTGDLDGLSPSLKTLMKNVMSSGIPVLKERQSIWWLFKP